MCSGEFNLFRFFSEEIYLGYIYIFYIRFTYLLLRAFLWDFYGVANLW